MIRLIEKYGARYYISVFSSFSFIYVFHHISASTVEGQQNLMKELNNFLFLIDASTKYGALREFRMSKEINMTVRTGFLYFTFLFMR